MNTKNRKLFSAFLALSLIILSFVIPMSSGLPAREGTRVSTVAVIWFGTGILAFITHLIDAKIRKICGIFSAAGYGIIGLLSVDNIGEKDEGVGLTLTSYTAHKTEQLETCPWKDGEV